MDTYYQDREGGRLVYFAYADNMKITLSAAHVRDALRRKLARLIVISE